MLKDLLKPESQSDPHHWAATLLAHAMIGVGLWLLTGSVLLVAVGYAAWELIQRGSVWDSILDWCGVVCGVGVVAYAVNGHRVEAAACFVAVLIVGIVGWFKRA